MQEIEGMKVEKFRSTDTAFTLRFSGNYDDIKSTFCINEDTGVAEITFYRRSIPALIQILLEGECQQA